MRWTWRLLLWPMVVPAFWISLSPSAMFGQAAASKTTDEIISQNLVLPSTPFDSVAVPDEHVFKVAIEFLQEFGRTHEPLLQDFVVHWNASSGLIYTDWYRGHKGEVRLKAEIGVSGTYVRTEVYHGIGFVNLVPTKTKEARRHERLIAEGIAERISSRAAAEVSAPSELHMCHLSS